jgi:hypothetical protein
MLESNNKMELNSKFTKLIDQHLKSRLIQAFLFLGIVNAGALYGIYTFVSEKAAELAVKKAISSTENKLNGLTEQFQQLSSRTTNGFADALMSIGEAKAKVDAINQDVLGLKSLKLKQVKEVTSLLNKSSAEIINVIESTKVLKDTKEITGTIEAKILALEAELNSYKTVSDKEISNNSELISDLVSRVSITTKNGSTLYKVGDILIETGTIFFSKISHVNQIKFNAEFESAPTVVAT